MAKERRPRSLLAVQSLVCGVLLLLILLLRLIGGNTWEQLNTVCRRWLLQDGFGEALVLERSVPDGA